MPAFPVQGGNYNTWGTDLRTFFAPYFDLTTGLWLVASIPASAVVQGLGSGLDADTVRTKAPAAVNGLATLDANTLLPLAQLPLLDHTTRLTNVGNNTHVAIDAFLASKAQANGLASLDISSHVVQDPASKAQALGVASLDGSAKVVQDPSSKHQANGVASLDGSTKLVERLSYEAAASGVATLDASSHVVQAGAVNPVTAAQANGVATLNASSLVAQDPASTGAWTDYSASSTIVGWSSFTTKVLRYMVIGKLVFVQYYLQGTSNSTLVTFTLPFGVPSLVVDVPASRVQDNSVIKTTPGLMEVAGPQASPSQFNFYTDMAGTAWTASGTKQASGEFFFAAS